MLRRKKQLRIVRVLTNCWMQNMAECLKEHRRLAGLTQEQLAAKIGTKKSYISKIENGHADVQLSTLFRIFAGLGKRVSLTVV